MSRLLRRALTTPIGPTKILNSKNGTKSITYVRAIIFLTSVKKKQI